MSTLSYRMDPSTYLAKCFRCDLPFTEEELNGLSKWYVEQGCTFRFHLRCADLNQREWIRHKLEVNSTKVS